LLKSNCKMSLKTHEPPPEVD